MVDYGLESMSKDKINEYITNYIINFSNQKPESAEIKNIIFSFIEKKFDIDPFVKCKCVLELLYQVTCLVKEPIFFDVYEQLLLLKSSHSGICLSEDNDIAILAYLTLLYKERIDSHNFSKDKDKELNFIKHEKDNMKLYNNDILAKKNNLFQPRFIDTKKIEILRFVSSSAYEWKLVEFRDESFIVAVEKKDIGRINLILNIHGVVMGRLQGINQNIARAVEGEAKLGHLDMVKLLIEKGIVINQTRALSEAARAGHLDIVKYLIENGAKEDFCFAFCCAAGSGHLDVVKYLVEKGANVNMPGYQPLPGAAKGGHLDVVKYLVDKGAKINFSSTLSEAAEGGYLEVIKYLFEKGADVNTSYDSPLIHAAKGGNLAVIKYLVEKGADFNNQRDLSLREAAGSGHLDVVKYLVEKGADVSIVSGYYSVLGNAAKGGHLDVVKYLVEKGGADVNMSEYPPLLDAIEGGYLDVVKYLVEKGADINMLEYSPLIQAVEGHCLDVVKYLIEEGANVNFVDEDGNTALKCAIDNNDKEIIKLLTINGAY